MPSYFYPLQINSSIQNFLINHLILIHLIYFQDFMIFFFFAFPYFHLSNAKDTTNFTTKCLQTDMASYMEVTHKQLLLLITNSKLTFKINKSLIVDVLLPYRIMSVCKHLVVKLVVSLALLFSLSPAFFSPLFLLFLSFISFDFFYFPFNYSPLTYFFSFPYFLSLFSPLAIIPLLIYFN
jgi:hypothetical protein